MKTSQSPANNTQTKTAETHAKRVLIVDDEEVLLRVMSRYLERRLGCEVVTAREREEAEALLEHQAFDLIVLDLALTGYGIEGLDLLRNVRHGSLGAAVLVLSGLITPELEAEALRQGADAVLPKPQPLDGIARVALHLMGMVA
jgi:CheY-like chemotaxis protein